MKKSLICSLLAVSLLSACAIDPYTGEQKVAKTAWGTGIGAAAGAGIGALAGGKKGALIGAGVGALAGAGTRRLYGCSGPQTARTAGRHRCSG